MAFFLVGGPLLWVASTLAIIAAASSTLTIGTMDAELFPTEVRGSSNGLMLVASVAGSAVGLLAAGWLAGPLGGLGRAIALCGLGPLVAALFLIRRLPESAHRALDEVSPSEVESGPATTA
jgi:MFS family permease